MNALWIDAVVAALSLVAGAAGTYTALRVRQAVQARDSEHIARDVAALETRHAERFARLEARVDEITKDVNGIGRAMRERDDQLLIQLQATNAKLLVIRQKVGLKADDLNLSLPPG